MQQVDQLEEAAAQVGAAAHGERLRAARAAVRVVGEELCVLGATVIMRRKQQQV